MHWSVNELLSLDEHYYNVLIEELDAEMKRASRD
jgi:hypothetical protein